MAVDHGAEDSLSRKSRVDGSEWSRKALVDAGRKKLRQFQQRRKMSPSPPPNTPSASSPIEESSQAILALERQLSRVKLSRTTSLGSRPVSMDGRARQSTTHTNDKQDAPPLKPSERLNRRNTIASSKHKPVFINLDGVNKVAPFITTQESRQTRTISRFSLPPPPRQVVSPSQTTIGSFIMTSPSATDTHTDYWISTPPSPNDTIQQQLDYATDYHHLKAQYDNALIDHAEDIKNLMAQHAMDREAWHRKEKALEAKIRSYEKGLGMASPTSPSSPRQTRWSGSSVSSAVSALSVVPTLLDAL